VRLRTILSESPIFQVEKIDKPWGYELIWARSNQYVGKILFVLAGHSLSLQYHRIKEEHIIVESGECTIECGHDEKSLMVIPIQPGQVIHLSPGMLHRISAKTDCRLYEVSTPQLDDVVRLKDQYGRT